MNISSALRLYLRSNTSIVADTVAIAGIVATALAGLPAVVPVAIGGLLIVFTIGMLFTRRGAVEIVHERDEIAGESMHTRLAAADAARERLARVRVPDSEVARAVDSFLLAVGEGLASCHREERFPPQLAESIDLASSVVTAYMASLDAASTERRYEPAQDPPAAPAIAPSDASAADPVSSQGPGPRAIALIRQYTRSVRETIQREFPDSNGDDRLSTLEEMQKP